MGIKNLSKFIKTNYPDCIVESDLTDLSYTKVAIDVPIYMYKYKSINAARINEPDYKSYDWLWSFIYIIHLLREHDIHPVFVFEGKSPIEKKETQTERKKVRKQLAERTKVLEESLEEYGVSQVPNELLQKQWEKILKQNKVALDCPFDFGSVSSSIELRRRYNIDITYHDYKILKVLLKVLSVPYIQASGEAEAFCALLEREKFVSAVLSTDTDLLAYGCKKLIIKISSDRYTYIDLNRVLFRTKLTLDKFLDFCIMCGTDYNNNIPGIGIQRSFKFCTSTASNLAVLTNQETVDKFARSKHLFRTFNDLLCDDEAKQRFEREVARTMWFCKKVNIYLLTYFATKFQLAFDPISLHKGFNITNVTFG